jgi:hypothetical protein
VIIDFERIAKLFGTNAAEINAAVSGALGPVDSTGTPRTTLYDPTWGYFLAGENTVMEHRDNRTYQDVSTFVIEGAFTINAEDAVAGVAAVGEDATFLRVVAKYDALEAAFDACARAVAPDDYSLWGTASDPRCVPLPLPLLDSDGHRIYALVEELVIQPGQWGKVIRYTATLREAKFPPAKVILNGHIIDHGVITITLPSPLLDRSDMAACVGEVMNIRNYTMLGVEVDGACSGTTAPNRLLTDAAYELSTSLLADKVDVGIVRLTPGGTETETLFTDLSVDDGSSIDAVHEDQAVSIHLAAKAGRA